MSDFDDVLSAGFTMLRDSMRAPTITHAGVTAKVIGTPIVKSKDQQNAGYWLAFKTVCELLRTDFVSLKLQDRSMVLVTSSDGTQTVSAKVIGIDGEEDDGDPCVRVTLERGDAPKPQRL